MNSALNLDIAAAKKSEAPISENEVIQIVGTSTDRFDLGTLSGLVDVQ